MIETGMRYASTKHTAHNQLKSHSDLLTPLWPHLAAQERALRQYVPPPTSSQGRRCCRGRWHGQLNHASLPPIDTELLNIKLAIAPPEK